MLNSRRHQCRSASARILSPRGPRPSALVAQGIEQRFPNSLADIHRYPRPPANARISTTGVRPRPLRWPSGQPLGCQPGCQAVGPGHHAGLREGNGEAEPCATLPAGSWDGRTNWVDPMPVPRTQAPHLRAQPPHRFGRLGGCGSPQPSRGQGRAVPRALPAQQAICPTQRHLAFGLSQCPVRYPWRLPSRCQPSGDDRLQAGPDPRTQRLSRRVLHPAPQECPRRLPRRIACHPSRAGMGRQGPSTQSRLRQA
jgi:hypothetical protein